MSKFCFIKFDDSNGDYNKLKVYGAIAKELEKHKLGMFVCTQNYFEIDDFDDMISVADTSKNDNCEMFLLPDGCAYNGRNNPLPFLERMNVLKNAIEKIQSYTKRVEVFIGECAANLDDFIQIRCSLNQFPTLADQKFYCQESHFINDLYFLIDI